MDYDTSTSTLRVRGWGFWAPDVALQFGSIVNGLLQTHADVTTLIMDLTKLKPMRDEGQESFGVLVASLRRKGGPHLTISTNSHLTKLQLLRIVAERGAGGNGAFYVTLNG